MIKLIRKIECLIKGHKNLSTYFRDGKTLAGDVCTYCWKTGELNSLRKRNENR